VDSNQPTAIYDSSLSQSGDRSLDVSQAKVGVVAGDGPEFSDETAALVRSRLTASALVLAAVLAAAFAGSLVSGNTSLWWCRLLILLVIAASLVCLRRCSSLSLHRLRLLELIVFGSVAVQISLMALSRFAEFSGDRDGTSLASVRQQFLMTWCILIFLYGTLMPNSWQRGAGIMIPAALFPYLLIGGQRWISPEFATLLKTDAASSPLPFTLVAAILAIFASYVINRARREAFKARQFGQYRLMERLGAGGMGEVYKAEHVLLKRPCAIKLIKAASEADSTVIARFEKEVKTTAKLTHWNTIEIFDYGRTEDGTFYYVMELLPGMNLEHLVEEHGRLPPERVVYLLAQICGALQEAHSVGLIHRDLKPANIFVSQRGGVFDVAKLLDFGLVKEVNEKSADGGRSASFSGTPLYMSPEQSVAYDEVDGRADIYSLGSVAYYLLTGQAPFTGRNVLELLAAHRNSEIIPPSQLNPTVSSDLEQVVLKCMAKNPSDRYQSADELKKALNNCAEASGWGADQAKAWWNGIGERPVELHAVNASAATRNRI
jgi:serine/threonine-protein kinase